MFIRFKVLRIETDLKEKKILIHSTHEIDTKTIVPANIRITQKGDTVEELLWDKWEINGKVITIYLIDTPLINEVYLVRIKNLKNIIDDTLETNYNQTISFDGLTSTNLCILTPSMHSVVKAITISFTEDKMPYDLVHYEIELGTDPIFSSVLMKTTTKSKEITLDSPIDGQLYVRIRSVYNIGAAAPLDATSATSYEKYSEWSSVTFVYKTEMQHLLSKALEPIYQEELKILAFPAQNKLQNTFSYLFDCTEVNIDIDSSISVLRKDTQTGITQECIVEIACLKNKLDITLFEPIQVNEVYTIVLKNLYGLPNKVLSYYEHTIYSKFEPCYAEPIDINTLLGFESDELMTLNQIKQASNLADYYSNIKLNSVSKNRLYYNAIPDAMIFEKSQFVKYYVCREVLLQTRTNLAIQSGLGGKLGEIEFSPKGSIPDLTSTFRHFATEADKWRLALQGYKEHPPDPSSTSKSLRCRPHDLHDRRDFV